MRRARFWLGSDRFGHDVVRQLLLGGRVSLSVAALAVLMALLVGTTVGLTAATGGRVVDAVLMRTVDALLAFPVLFLLILVATVFHPGPMVLVAVLGLTSWMGLARLVRGQVLSLRGRTFILAARAAGAPPRRIWRTHYLPNLVGPLSQDTALRLGDLVLAEATLSYLGLGIPPDIPTWGSMVSQGHRVMIDGWWLATFPGFAIAFLVISLALVGDGLQERLSGVSSKQ
jgi:peptide/nickel transport system permease protein